METTQIQRHLTCLVHNISFGHEPAVMPCELTWNPSDPEIVTARFVSDDPGRAADRVWEIGLGFLEEALEKGHAGHPNVSPCLAEVSGEDFVLTLRGLADNGQVAVSDITFDSEQILLFTLQVHQQSE